VLSTVAPGSTSARDGSGLTLLTPDRTRRSWRGLASVWSLSCAKNQLKRDTRTLAGQSRELSRAVESDSLKQRAGAIRLRTSNSGLRERPKGAKTGGTGTRRASPSGICDCATTGMRTVSSSASPAMLPGRDERPRFLYGQGAPADQWLIGDIDPRGRPDRGAPLPLHRAVRARACAILSCRSEASPLPRRAFGEPARWQSEPSSRRAARGRRTPRR